MNTQAIRIMRGKIVQRWDHEPTSYKQYRNGSANGPERGIAPEHYGDAHIYSVGQGTLNVIGETYDPARVIRGAESVSTVALSATISYVITPKTIDQVKADKLREINAAYEAAVGPISSSYPESELHTFSKQEKECDAFEADPQAWTPFVQAMSEQRGITKAEYMSKIRANINTYQALVGTATGMRHGREDAINAAATIDEVLVVTW